MSSAGPTVNYDAPVRDSEWRVSGRQSGPRLWLGQTWSLLADAYRDLNSRKMFWITLILSGLIAGVLGLVGYGPEGVSLAGWDLFPFPNSDFVPARDFYIDLFLNWGVGLWITWAATILAIISTAGIVPDLITGGSVDLYLSKPLGRARLFLTKYLSGLLFVALQILIFAIASFLVIGLRGGAWAWSIFLIVPVVTVYYSFLFCVCALVGMWTGSSLASILVTLLFWVMLAIINFADANLLMFRTLFEVNASGAQRQLDDNRNLLADWEARDRPPGAIRVNGLRRQIEIGQDNLRRSNELVDQIAWWHDLLLTIKAPLPKTGETISNLNRWLVESEELAPTRVAVVSEPLVNLSDLEDEVGDEDEGDADADAATTAPATAPASTLNDEEREELERLRSRARNREQGRQFERALESDELEQSVEANYLNRSPLWSWGTSLGFEAVLLLIATWSFSRRDF